MYIHIVSDIYTALILKGTSGTVADIINNDPLRSARLFLRKQAYIETKP